MTDAERLRAVAEVIGTWLHDPVPSNAELIARIRALLDDAPSVEWHQQSNGDQYAELDGGWKLLTQQRDDGGYSVTVQRGTDLSASEWHIPYRDSAQRRALALYAALRGVTS